jgi:hypothetical protein
VNGRALVGASAAHPRSRGGNKGEIERKIESHLGKHGHEILEAFASARRKAFNVSSAKADESLVFALASEEFRELVASGATL